MEKGLSDLPEQPNKCRRTQVTEYGNLSVGILTYLAAIGLLAYEIVRCGVFSLNCNEDSRDTLSISLLLVNY